LPQRVEVVDDAALPAHLAVTNLENVTWASKSV
jgi:hypothetical protein